MLFPCISGWRPRRTILFASWDAEEFGLLGSTEWAEVCQNLLPYKFVQMSKQLGLFCEAWKNNK